jgi:predicted enzyme related to lactoylglutathione lyase
MNSMIKRFERLEIAASDLDDAARVYQANFGFTVRRPAGSEEAVIAIGDSEIRLRSGAAAAPQIAANGEGLMAVWLEADDVDMVAAALDRAGLERRPVRREGGWRVLEIDPKSANMTPLFIFDRRQ